MRAHLSIVAPSLARGMSVTLNNGQEISVGSSRWADIVVDDHTLSGLQFQVSMLPTECWLRDLKSSTGTFVNGTRVTATEIRDGDVIQSGETSITITLISDHALLAVNNLVPCEFRLPPDLLVQCSTASLANGLFRLSSDRVRVRTIAIECIPQGLGILVNASRVSDEFHDLVKGIDVGDSLTWFTVSPEIVDECLVRYWDSNDAVWLVGNVNANSVEWLADQSNDWNESVLLREPLKEFASISPDGLFSQFVGTIVKDPSMANGWAVYSRLQTESARTERLSGKKSTRRKGRISSVA